MIFHSGIVCIFKGYFFLIGNCRCVFQQIKIVVITQTSGLKATEMKMIKPNSLDKPVLIR